MVKSVIFNYVIIIYYNVSHTVPQLGEFQNVITLDITIPSYLKEPLKGPSVITTYQPE